MAAKSNLTAASFNQNAVVINGGSTLQLHGLTQTGSVTNSLTLNGSGVLNLGANGIVVNYTWKHSRFRPSIRDWQPLLWPTNPEASTPGTTIGYAEASTIFGSNGSGWLQRRNDSWE